MGVRSSTLWYVNTSDSPAVMGAGVANEKHADRAVAERLFPDNVIEPLGIWPLAAGAAAGPDQLYVGSFGQLTVVAHADLAVTRPTDLDPRWLATSSRSAAVLVHTDPDYGLGVLARWERGAARRVFVATPTDIYVNEGLPYPFEQPFWAGERPLQYVEGVPPEPFALPFHPQEFAEEALREWFRFRFTPPIREGDLDPQSIPVSRFVIHPPGTQLAAPPQPVATPAEAPSEPAHNKRWPRRSRR